MTSWRWKQPCVMYETSEQLLCKWIISYYIKWLFLQELEIKNQLKSRLNIKNKNCGGWVHFDLHKSVAKHQNINFSEEFIG